MIFKTIIVEKEASVLSITLNRPQIRNAFNDELITELIEILAEKTNDPEIRILVLQGAGEVFCAGGDIEWMKKSAASSRDQNRVDAQKFAGLITLLNEFPTPVICGVHGACFGGGIGLAAASDYVIASSETIFSFSEVKLGLIPAVIAPFVIAKIGESATRALFLSAERFPAARAFGLGLVHRVVENKAVLNQAIHGLAQEIKEASPHALKEAKRFIHRIREKSFSEKLETAAQTLADLRASPEGQEGLTAFLEKRKPNWVE